MVLGAHTEVAVLFGASSHAEFPSGFCVKSKFAFSFQLVQLVALAAVLPSALAGDGSLRVEIIKTDPPSELSQAIQKTLDKNVLRIMQREKKFAEFWFRTEVPTVESSSTELGVEYGQLKEGTLIGVLRLSLKWFDYKNIPISPGVYTLRYGIQPADGNHMGVAMYRDFLLLIPAAIDKKADYEYSHDDLAETSSEASLGKHPATLSLFPVYEEITQPKLIKNEMDQWMLVSRSGSLSLGLVMLGHGEVE